MRLELEIISEEKYSLKLYDGETLLHSEERYHTYMDQKVFRRRDVGNLIVHLEELFGGKITEVKNLIY